MIIMRKLRETNKSKIMHHLYQWFWLKKISYPFVKVVLGKKTRIVVVSELTKMLQWRAVTYVVSGNGGLGQTVTARPVTVT